MATLAQFPALAQTNLPRPHALHRIHLRDQMWVECCCGWVQEVFTSDPPTECGVQWAEAERQLVMAIQNGNVKREIEKGKREWVRLQKLLG